MRAAMQRVTDVKLIAVDDSVDITEKAQSVNSPEYIIIKKNYQNHSITEGYFYCIRNALAHGDFDVDGIIYAMKNESRGKVKGIAKIKESSLLAWIDLVNLDIDNIKKAGKNKQSQP